MSYVMRSLIRDRITVHVVHAWLGSAASACAILAIIGLSHERGMNEYLCYHFRSMQAPSTYFPIYAHPLSDVLSSRSNYLPTNDYSPYYHDQSSNLFNISRSFLAVSTRPFYTALAHKTSHCEATIVSSAAIAPLAFTFACRRAKHAKPSIVARPSRRTSSRPVFTSSL